MNDVSIFVEGPTDALAMQSLPSGLLTRLAMQGTSVHFHPMGGKQAVVYTVPSKAARTIVANPYALVIALPDLYPRDVGFPHRTLPELDHAMHRRFAEELGRMQVDDARLSDRFRVFCFKHDLEVLLLAVWQELGSYLGKAKLSQSWVLLIENQNFDTPPKRVVQALFQECGRRYVDVDDAPAILRAANYHDIAAACPQCFQPFVSYLESLLDTEAQ